MSGNWLVFSLGFVAQILFSARMLVQWILSEKKKDVVNPTLFWALSLCASFIFFFYGWLRNDFSIMLGQVIGYYVYIWNLGAKGVWGRITAGLRQLTIAVLMAAPVLCVTLLVRDNPRAIADTLFRNDDIPVWLLVFGSAGQVVFSFRFLYQFIYSSRRKESSLPPGFWIISVVGAMIIFIYGVIRKDPVILLAQGCGLFTYVRNLMLWKRNSRS